MAVEDDVDEGVLVDLVTVVEATVVFAVEVLRVTVELPALTLLIEVTLLVELANETLALEVVVEFPPPNVAGPV